MKKMLAIAAMIGVFGQANAGFFTGSNIMEWVESDDRVVQNRGQQNDDQRRILLLGYIAGINDSLDGYAFCSLNKASVAQLLAITKNYIAARPARWGEKGSNLVMEALKGAFPCPKRR
ncbi:Rap1a/Tai family immunity protein [Glaciimonas sp. PAMC28666]|uniref:Rap1a/Tai family immunity protein n=1 Tax=Glaciimonas sp. PAMC28666 TaxID=2807626 RepID=UPI00196412CE|nr:Rap1a/Tai family immunity protein [Glaciimonas sp. PAMC28666]QRX83253.1 hypothetical protein JQN73_02960 [Glaciimonas sp. PAMC28666]